MAHRGIRSRVADLRGSSVGHVRLPIVGTGEDHDQPLVQGPWTVAFAGEVLDFREWRPGAECDADLVADTWADWGPQGFCSFDGFWSVLAVDSGDGSVHALCDYLGQKPLYVRDDGLVRAVASEPDAVACLAPVLLDGVYLSAVAKWGYCPETWRTPYLGVRRVLPGECVTIPRRGPVVRRVVDVLTPELVTPEELRSEVEAAVRRRVLSSDVPVACLVSGGLDSAAVWTLARRYGEVRAYHFPNGEEAEAREVAPGLTVLDGSGGRVDLGTALDWMQEPLDLGSLVPQASLAQAVRDGGGERVCLTGDGADEFLGGYGRAARYDSRDSDVWHELVAWHLPRLDRVMMRAPTEVRSPFLARRVASGFLALPRPERTDKRVLRDLFRRDLPPGVADRPKRPLRTPEVAADREARSIELASMFRRRVARINEEVLGCR
jgi:asparagine synthase (glutamine-hydrolysing)